MTLLRARGIAWLVSLSCVVSRADALAQANVSAFSRAKAESLLRDHLPCLGCHKLHGDGGTIGPDLTTVRERRSAAYVASMIADPQRMVPGSGMPRTAMSASVRDLITRYLTKGEEGGKGGEGGTRAAGVTGASAADGAALYAKWCAACHGASGRGDGPNAANLPAKPANHASKEAMSARPDDSLFDTIAAGGAVMNRSPRMPAFGATLSSAEIRALVKHIRTLCACEGPRWSRQP